MLDLADFRIDGADWAGLVVMPPAVAKVRGLTLSHAQSAHAAPGGGSGVYVGRGAGLRVERGAFLDNSTRALAVLGELQLEGALVTRTAADAVVVDTGNLTLTDAVVSRSRGAGLATIGGESHLRNAVLADNVVGVRSQLDGRPELTDSEPTGNEQGEEQCAAGCIDKPQAPPPPMLFDRSE